MITLTNARYTDFFSFFNISEIGREKQENHNTWITYKPGGFQEHIDIEFLIDADEFIRKCSLMLDRVWVGDEKSLNVFAKDIAKSFIKDLVDEDSKERIIPIVDALYNVRGFNDHVVTLDGDNPPTIQDVAQPELRKMLEVFSGVKKFWEYKIQNLEILFENIINDRIPRIKISIIYYE